MTNMIRLVTFLPSMVLVAWLYCAAVWRLCFSSKVKQTRDMDDPIHEFESIFQWKEKYIVCGMISIDVLWIRRFDNKWEYDVEWSDQIGMDIRNESLFFSATELAHVTYLVNLFSAIANNYKSLSSLGTISVERWRSHCVWERCEVTGETKRLFATVWWFRRRSIAFQNHQCVSPEGTSKQLTGYSSEINCTISRRKLPLYRLVDIFFFSCRNIAILS